MTLLPDIPVMILAGGNSSRFGSPKGLAELNGTPLLSIVHDRLIKQTSGPIALNANPSGPYSNQGLGCIPDIYKGQIGPLAGIHTAIIWAKHLGYDTVVTAPVDVPFLPTNYLKKLTAAASNSPVIASSSDRLHPVCGLWPVFLRETLETDIQNGLRAAHAWAKHCDAAHITFPQAENGRDPFFNINTPENLTSASAK